MSGFRNASRVLSIAAALALGAVTMSASAHHSFGRYEMTKTVDIEGTVDKFEWSNPHCWLFVDVPVEGKSVTYGFEMQSVGEMLRRGWVKTSVKPGDKVKVSFHPVRDGSPAGLQMMTFRDGTLVGKPMPGGGPPPDAGAAPAANSAPASN
jgi:hypothetical protein